MTCPRGQSDLNAGPVLRRRGSGGEETLCSWFRFSRLIQKSLTLFCPRANYYMAPVQTLLLQLSNARVTVACNGGVNIEAWMATELSRADGGTHIRRRTSGGRWPPYGKTFRPLAGARSDVRAACRRSTPLRRRSSAPTSRRPIARRHGPPIPRSPSGSPPQQQAMGWWRSARH